MNAKRFGSATGEGQANPAYCWGKHHPDRADPCRSSAAGLHAAGDQGWTGCLGGRCTFSVLAAVVFERPGQPTGDSHETGTLGAPPPFSHRPLPELGTDRPKEVPTRSTIELDPTDGLGRGGHSGSGGQGEKAEEGDCSPSQASPLGHVTAPRTAHTRS